MTPMTTREPIALYMAITPAQLTSLAEHRWRELDPAQATHCYLKLSQRYAEMVARQRILPECGGAHVVCLQLPAVVMRAYDLQSVAYEEHLEYCVPAAEIRPLCWYLEEDIRVVSVFRPQCSFSVPCGSRPIASLMS